MIQAPNIHARITAQTGMLNNRGFSIARGCRQVTKMILQPSARARRDTKKGRGSTALNRCGIACSVMAEEKALHFGCWNAGRLQRVPAVSGRRADCGGG
jgi:hypothetical protein